MEGTAVYRFGPFLLSAEKAVVHEGGGGTETGGTGGENAANSVSKSVRRLIKNEHKFRIFLNVERRFEG